ncbi:MAG: (Fe-S)-binding protein [Elusimicrobiales bacterium]
MKRYNELYTPNTPHLKGIITQNGTFDIYDAVSRCTRCGYCIETCPTYAILNDERLSPRGRNITVRALIEGRLKDVRYASFSIDSCLLCSACSDVCYGDVPTPDVILEARREKRSLYEQAILKFILRMREKANVFDLIVKIFYLMIKAGLLKIADKLGFFKLIGFPALCEVSKKLFNPPLKFLHESIERYININQNTSTKWVYFLTCGTDYLFPNVGKSTLRVMNKIFGNIIFMKNKCCGLISYNYGDLEDARKLAIENINIYLELRKIHKDLLIVVDCSSCAAFMKKYPQLFIDSPYYDSAIEFSSKVKDIIEVIRPQHITGPLPKELKNKKITIHHSCKAYREEKLKDNQEKVLLPLFKENLINLDEVMCCGGAGAYTFTHPQYSHQILLRKIKNIAETHAEITVVSSTSCLMQLGYGKTKYYPYTEVIHYIELIDKIIG